MSNSDKPRCIIKVSGESLKSVDSTFSSSFIKNLTLQIAELAQMGVQPVVIPGGGNICRQKDLAPIFELTNTSHRVYLDYAGMISTVVNAVILKIAIEKYTKLKATILTMIDAPSEIASSYNLDRAETILNTNKILIIAGGIGQPDFSSDVGVFSKARELGAKLVLMGKSGISGVYNDDPNLNPNSKLMAKTTFSNVINQRLDIIDMAAAAIGLTNNFCVRIFDIKKPQAIVNAWKKIGIFSDVTN